VLLLEINQYGFFGVDVNILTNYGPILIFPNFLNLVFCFLIKNIMYSMLYLFQKLKKSDYMS